MKIIAGNWKMNGTVGALRDMYAGMSEIQTNNNVIICVPFTLLNIQGSNGIEKPTNLSIGAQDVSAHNNGAFTGEISAQMIANTHAKYVVVGHSERRQYHSETNDIVREKATRALENGLTPIICIGELMEEKQAGKTFDVIECQLRNSVPANQSGIIIAYEPRWAIGAGLTPTEKEIADAHALIAKTLESMGLANTPILYGASVKGSNAAEIMSIPNVDGVLVGGASLKPDDFIPIIESVK